MVQKLEELVSTRQVASRTRQVAGEINHRRAAGCTDRTGQRQYTDRSISERLHVLQNPRLAIKPAAPGKDFVEPLFVHRKQKRDCRVLSMSARQTEAALSWDLPVEGQKPEVPPRLLMVGPQQALCVSLNQLDPREDEVMLPHILRDRGWLQLEAHRLWPG